MRSECVGYSAEYVTDVCKKTKQRKGKRKKHIIDKGKQKEKETENQREESKHIEPHRTT